MGKSVAKIENLRVIRSVADRPKVRAHVGLTDSISFNHDTKYDNIATGSLAYGLILYLKFELDYTVLFLLGAQRLHACLWHEFWDG